ncbi:hypothetical protein KJ751_02530 [Patescibacteria group bacterium]|nr:hypothetical protein [Patescibacteria group bacterium]
MTNTNQQNLLKEVEQLLTQQTAVILNAVDKKLEQTTNEFKKEINGLVNLETKLA